MMEGWRLPKRLQVLCTSGIYYSPFKIKEFDFVAWRLATLGAWEANAQWNRARFKAEALLARPTGTPEG